MIQPPAYAPERAVQYWAMTKRRVPKEVLEYLRQLGQRTGAEGGRHRCREDDARAAPGASAEGGPGDVAEAAEEEIVILRERIVGVLFGLAALRSAAPTADADPVGGPAA